MKMLIIGTIPDENLPLVSGNLSYDDGILKIDEQPFTLERGTTAMASAACQTCKALGVSMPYGVFAGDIGYGDGSRLLYQYLIENVANLKAKTIVFHYFLPDVNLHNKALKTLNSMNERPILIADAGYMYVAKMSGHASEYDLFTPDIGELAFLADEDAPHPFYTRGFILHDAQNIDEKIKRAYKFKNSSKVLLVKGETDYIASESRIIDKITEPIIENLEPIGGTGDTITGIASALVHSGHDLIKSAITACKVNRIAGQLANPTPATQVGEIIERIPDAVVSIHH